MEKSQPQCINCLNSSIGVCNIHQPDMVWQTFTATISEPLTKKEIEREIIYYASRYSEKKWYQSKKWLLNKIRYYCEELNKLNK